MSVLHMCGHSFTNMFNFWLFYCTWFVSVLARCSWAWMSRYICRIWRIVLTQPVMSRHSCSSFNVARGLLSNSLSSFILIISWILSHIFSTCLHCIPLYIWCHGCFVPFSWLILWKLSKVHTTRKETFFSLVVQVIGRIKCGKRVCNDWSLSNVTSKILSFSQGCVKSWYPLYAQSTFSCQHMMHILWSFLAG